MSTDQSPLLTEIRDGVAYLTLNRPQQRNALSMALMTELENAVNNIGTDDTARVVVIRAQGPAFCAGHDLREMRADPREAAQQKTFEQCARMMKSIIACPKPVIAAVHGIATAAGCQLVATCDLAIATADARFATPGVNIGLFCSTPMVALSRNVGRKQAMEMLLTGDFVDAQTAEKIGLINHVVDKELLGDAVQALALNIASKSSLTLRIGKEAFYRQLEMGLSDAYEYTGAVMVRNMLTEDAAEGIDAFLQKRDPKWRGC